MSDVPAWVWEQEKAEREAVRRRLEGGREGLPVSSAHDATPKAEVIAPLAAMRGDFERRMGSLVCRGEVDRVPYCFGVDRRSCPERDAADCPRRIVEFEARRTASQGAPVGLAEIYEGFGIPAGIAKTLTGVDHPFEIRRAVQKAESWWNTKPRPRVLVLHGGSQIGKSVGAAALVATWSGRFVHVPTGFRNRVRDSAYQQALLYPALLVFDDLGGESLDGLDEVKGRFDGVFCARVDAGLFTVITTNSASEIRSRYGARVAERINKHGLVEVIGKEEQP